MEPEWIAIPTDGMRRWLQLELARSLGEVRAGAGDGVTANIGSGSRARCARPCSRPTAPTTACDPWRVDQLVWAVLDVLHASRGDDRLGPLTTLPAGGTWFGRARRLADLFDRYAVRRPR